MKEHTIIAVISCCAVTWSAAAETIGIAVRGEPAEYAIVIPEKASAVERYAAEELQSFLEKVTGVKLPVATDDKPLPEKAIILGETRHSFAVLNGGQRAGRPTVAEGRDAPPYRLDEFDQKALGSDGFRIASRPPQSTRCASGGWAP